MISLSIKLLHNLELYFDQKQLLCDYFILVGAGVGAGVGVGVGAVVGV